LAKTIVAKQEIIDRALDESIGAEEPIAVPESIRPRREELREPLPDEVAAAAHEAIRLLAAMDRDHAALRNAAGFSRYDSALGHMLAGAKILSPGQAHLARKLALRYRRQLPAELVARLEQEVVHA
jgi:hypothetical protein